MKFEGSREVNSGTKAVWDFLMDPHNLAECLPDATGTEVLDSSTIKTHLKVSVGFIKETFDSKISYGDVDREGKKVRLTIDAKGKNNSSTVNIGVIVEGDDTKSKLSWDVEAVMAGRLASIGQRYISKVADRIIEKSFECMMGKL